MNMRPGAMSHLLAVLPVLSPLLPAAADVAPPAMAPGEAFDAAPFGWPLADPDGRSFGVRWAEPRKVRKLIVEFAAGTVLPPIEQVRVEYWQRAWSGHADVPSAERNAGSAGWQQMDDWYNGVWKTAAAHVAVEQSTWVITFDPTSEREFEGFSGPGVTYRQTLQIRVASDGALPKPAKLRALTEALCKPLSVRIRFGWPTGSAFEKLGLEEGQVEVFNGALADLRGEHHAVARPGSDGRWSATDPRLGRLTADLVLAADPVDPRYDRTIVTVRSTVRPFSFAADEVARGDRILIDDLGVLVTRADDPITLEEYRDQQRERGRKTVYTRVLDEPEQTLARAWADMPLKRPLWFVHGLPGNRNAVRQYPDGSLLITANPHWFRNPTSPRDTERKLWSGDYLRLSFGLPASPIPGRELRDGWLPVLRTWWQDGPLYYEQTTALDTLSGDLTRIPLDEPTVLLMRVRIVNTSATWPATARLRCTSQGASAPETLTRDGDRMFADFGGQPRVRYLVDAGGRGAFAPEAGAVSWSLALDPGGRHELQFRIPTITLTTDEELAALRGVDMAQRFERLAAFWRELTTQGTQIATPEPWLNDFYRAHLGHLLVNCVQELDSDRLHAHVGTLDYGVFPNESVMMISDLDRRGLHDLARRCYESFIHYQGTVRFAGDYEMQDGLFYGAGGHEMGSYNKSHGYVLWGLAQHWFYTRDSAWLHQVAPALVKGCEWVIHERRRTMTETPQSADDRPLDYGWLPKGSLEDVTDYWNWLATNAATVWGLEAVADALADYELPHATGLQAEARAYRADFLRGMQQARILAPVVGLRDGTYVPKFPSRLYERGRSAGWIRETLEGAMFLPAYGLLAADAPETRWILEDYEDNLYISDTYGYSIPAFESFWFSRGGFSMQANLLDGPLPYLYRDDIKHYVRAFFNGFASAFYPETCMCNEHCLPELGFPVGDHFKTSDEAQVAYWLRLMFVRETGCALYLGQALPRYWLADGRTVSIVRAATHFGPLSFSIESHAAAGEIHATLTPPERNRPNRIYVRLRHPDARPLQGVTVNGRDFRDFDVTKEWLVLPGDVAGVQQIIARY